MEILESDAQLVHCKVTCLCSKQVFLLTMVYGFNKEGHRRTLWSHLKLIQATVLGPWCVMGDFNNVLEPGDRIGGREVTAHEIKNFKSCIEECDLQDITATGGSFTWSNRQSDGTRIFSKIDRCLVNCDWILHMDYTAEFLPEGISDHTPILLSAHCTVSTKSVFRFCDMWITRPAFKDIVQSTLLTEVRGCAMYT